MKKKLYLDACIFTAYVHSKHKNHEIVKNCLKLLSEFEIELFSSEWALVEMRKSLKRDYNYSKNKVESIAKNFRNNPKIDDLKIKFIDVDTKKRYGFEEFFLYLKDQMMESKKIHLADLIHSLIMSNNEIATILTTDSDFIALEQVITLHPKQVLIFKPKK